MGNGQTLRGILTKGVGGFYYVETADTVYECRARGIFRKEGTTPLVGDQVIITVSDAHDPVLDEILPRKNSLIRPPLANVDRLLIVVSVCEPNPNPLVIDQLTAIAVSQRIEPVVVVNKSDLGEPDTLSDIYRKAGIETCAVSASTGLGMEQVRALLTGKLNAFTGNSGVGKSSILNMIDPRLGLPTGEISKKLGRGRHTTRSVELFHLPGGGYVADTPGFSALDLGRVQAVGKDELPHCFPEFASFLGNCRFTSCAHVAELGCAVRAAVETGAVHPSRYQSYVALYQAVKDQKEWQKKTKDV